jgi:outer membrane receptor protein involved in Fe transport
MMPDATSNTAGKTRTIDNPFFALNEQVNDQSAARVFGNVFAEYGIASWLTLTSSLGADYASDARLEGCPAECSGSATGGRVIKGTLASYEIDHSLAGTARWSRGDELYGAFTLGQNLNARRVRTLSSVGRGLSAPRSFSILNTLAHDAPSDYETEAHGESYFGQANITLFNQLLLSGALRNDGSTTFGADAPRQWFPKATAVWQFSEHLGLSALRVGRVRASYGEAGLEPDPYLTSQAFTASTLQGGVVPGTGLTPTQNGLSGLFTSTTKPAGALRPERTREIEVGFDLGFGDRLDLSAAWYRARTSDAILVTPIPPSSGFSTEVKNAGVFSNKGMEVSLNLRPIMRTNFSWDVGAGWSRNVSRVESIGDAPYLLTDISLLQSVAQPGHPLGVFLGNGWLRCGLSPNDANPAIDLATLCAGQPRGATYIDDGTHCSPAPGMPCGDDLVRIIGDPNPDWIGNVHTTVRVKQLRISGLLDVKYGGDVWNGTKGILYGYGTHRDTENRAVCALAASKLVCAGNERAFGDAGFYPGAAVGPGAGTAVPIGENWYHASGLAACPFTGYDEPCVEDGGFVKLRELSFAYTFDQPWVARALGMTSLDLRVAGRNLMTWTKYTGFDPETSLGGASARIGGQDYFNLPLTRSFVLTIGLNR